MITEVLRLCGFARSIPVWPTFITPVFGNPNAELFVQEERNGVVMGVRPFCRGENFQQLPIKERGWQIQEGGPAIFGFEVNNNDVVIGVGPALADVLLLIFEVFPDVQRLRFTFAAVSRFDGYMRNALPPLLHGQSPLTRFVQSSDRQRFFTHSLLTHIGRGDRAKVLHRLFVLHGPLGIGSDSSAFGKCLDAIADLGAETQFRRAFELAKLRRFSQAVAGDNEIADGLVESASPSPRHCAARSLLNMGHTHGLMGDSHLELAVYHDMLLRFGDEQDALVRLEVAKALVNIGTVLGETEGWAAELKAYERALEWIGDSSDPAMSLQVAFALSNSARVLCEMGEISEAIFLLEDLTDRIRFGSSIVVDFEVVQAHLNLGILFQFVGDEARAIDYYVVAAILARTRTTTDFRRLAMNGLKRKAQILRKRQHFSDATHASSEALAMSFGAPDERTQTDIDRLAELRKTYFREDSDGQLSAPNPNVRHYFAEDG